MTTGGLRFLGEYDATGNPRRWFAGAPARDLGAAEAAHLSAEQRAAMVASGLYAEQAAPEPAETTESDKPRRERAPAERTRTATP